MDIHLAFRNLDMSPALASSLIDRDMFPERSFAICVMSGVGTTRWFLLPISTYLLDWTVEDGYRSKDSEVVVGQVA